jgi:hypothetical protein
MMDRMMKNDKSQRLALVAITEKNQYHISAMTEAFYVKAEIYKKVKS